MKQQNAAAANRRQPRRANSTNAISKEMRKLIRQVKSAIVELISSGRRKLFCRGAASGH